MFPAEMSITEVAFMVGVPRHVIEHRVETGALPTTRPSGNPRGKRVVPLADVRRMLGSEWESVVERLRLLRTEEVA